ncbi:hypothetical protein PRBRB14_22110 [Hallella multisaccharivorax DSM 17128]|uniref:Helix-turn-helix domain-containing protein n=1 Tax=Hallella multisaccharivorax DSM 17128 TaxID=688246 RepID=F8N7G8_9BACT|nr:hypothetical protein [Hallella multisaccharivorax]EGN57428.1 hypothetical protein Premu_2033 [Hallella multisaccharivorax DSM 17128]GJG31332.1 hypothetical protein PRBRB14_22110 [Hallella multisaccharivorax DSM 17128]
MERALTQQIEAMCKMLVKTREDVKVLRHEVCNLHMILAGDVPPPIEGPPATIDNDEEDILRAKNILVGSREVMEILQISDTTLKRWRKEGRITFKYESMNHVSYKLASIYEGINTGSIKCKGIDKITALARILTYSKNISQFRAMGNT